MIDIKSVTNLRGETFARAIIPKEPTEGKQQKAKLMLASNFEVKIIRNNEKQDHHVLIDTQIILDGLEENKLNYNMMLTLWLYDIRTLQMMPIG